MPHAPAPTTVTRQSDLELVTTRSFQAPAQAVFAAWTTASLFQQWWAPKSSGVPLLDCEMDARTGGGYRLVFGHDAENSMAFYGRYLDVAAPARLVWTNEENEEGAVTTVTLAEVDGATLLTLHERYPTTAARDESYEGMEACLPEQFAQLDALLATLSDQASS